MKKTNKGLAAAFFFSSVGLASMSGYAVYQGIEIDELKEKNTIHQSITNTYGETSLELCNRKYDEKFCTKAAALDVVNEMTKKNKVKLVKGENKNG